MDWHVRARTLGSASLEKERGRGVENVHTGYDKLMAGR